MTRFIPYRQGVRTQCEWCREPTESCVCASSDWAPIHKVFGPGPQVPFDEPDYDGGAPMSSSPPEPPPAPTGAAVGAYARRARS